EHPVGIFLLPAFAGRLGYAPFQAGFLVGAVFAILSLCMLRAVAASVVGSRAAAVVGWVALILPTAFVYRIRATQEYPVLLLLLIALYATEKSRRAPAWIALVITAACATALMKGIFVAFVFGVCGLWLLCVRDGERRDVAPWLGLALSAVAVLAVAAVYENAYH